MYEKEVKLSEALGGKYCGSLGGNIGTLDRWKQTTHGNAEKPTDWLLPTTRLRFVYNWMYPPANAVRKKAFVLLRLCRLKLS